MRKRKSRSQKIFDQVCIHLIFLLSAFLILLLGIRTAGRTIDFAQAEKIEIINHLVDGLSESSKLTVQGKRLQTVVYKYLEALVEAVADFEFIPRNDFSVLTQVINALPEETEVLSFTYHGRNLSIRTAQPTARQVLEMVEKLEQRVQPGDHGKEKQHDQQPAEPIRMPAGLEIGDHARAAEHRQPGGH